MTKIAEKHRKKLSASILYELRCATGNFFSIFFGLVFPMFMLFIIGKFQLGDVPKEAYGEVITQIFLAMALIIPMAIMFIGYSAVYSQELERNSPLRLELFGFSPNRMLLARLIAYTIFLVICLVIYTVYGFAMFDITAPDAAAAVISAIMMLLISTLFLILAHAIAYAVRKFGVTYGITMTLYFVFMILSGSMGVSPKLFPEPLKLIAKQLPMYHIGLDDFYSFWIGAEYNAAPLVQSFLAFGLLVVLVYVLALYIRRRRSQ